MLPDDLVAFLSRKTTNRREVRIPDQPHSRSAGRRVRWSARKGLLSHMNSNGNPGSLVASHPGSTNAVQYGVYSSRVIGPRAAEIAAHLTEAFEFSVPQRIAVEQVARCIAILEALDHDLDERGLVDKRGEPRHLLNHRSRLSRQLDQWLTKITSSMERQSSDGQPASVGRPDYVRELQRIALGRDTAAGTRDRVSALKELLSFDSTPQQPATVTFVVHKNVDGSTEIVDSPLENNGDEITAGP